MLTQKINNQCIIIAFSRCIIEVQNIRYSAYSVLISRVQVVNLHAYDLRSSRERSFQ